MRDGKTMVKDLAATLNIVLVILVFWGFVPFWPLVGSMQVGSGEVYSLSSLFPSISS